jgi:cell division transport system permease protein
VSEETRPNPSPGPPPRKPVKGPPKGGGYAGHPPGERARAPTTEPRRPVVEAVAVPVADRPKAEVVQLSFAPQRRRRRPWTLAANLFRLTVLGAVRSWRRNARLLAPALGTMALLLLLGGTLAVAGVAGRTILTYESQQASILHVYLRDDASDSDVAALRRSLAAHPNVRSVTYVDKAAALARARQRPGLAQLATAAGSNPFPASLDVQVDAPDDVGKVAAAAGANSSAEPARPTSYDHDTYGQLRRLFLIGAGIAGGFALLMAFITYAVSANSLRAVVLSRREELATMQMLGASPWLLRARLLIEGSMTGGAAGAMAALVVAAAVAGAAGLDHHLFVQLLPGVNGQVATAAGAGLALAGAAIGGAGSLFAFRRLPN